MPKIVINEYDLTKAGTSEYSNFSVVVPGYLADDKYLTDADGTFQIEDRDGKKFRKLKPEVAAVFDENGVYECSSQADFIANVGMKAAISTTNHVSKPEAAAVVSVVINHEPNLPANFMYVGAKTDKNGKQTSPAVCKYKEMTDFIKALSYVQDGNWIPDPTNKGDLQTAAKANNATTTAGDKNTKATYALYSASPNAIGRPGYLRDNEFTYHKVFLEVDQTVTTATVDGETLILNSKAAVSGKTYYAIKTGDEGKDGELITANVTHYGNQMAYELLGLGYTVLYKYMSAEALPIEDITTLYSKEKATAFTTAPGGEYILKSEYVKFDELEEPSFWECLKDKSTYDFRYLVTGLLTNNETANSRILEIADHSEEVLLDDASLADGRGDCIALIDVDRSAYAGKSQAAAIPELAKQAAKYASTYAAVFAPEVTYIMAEVEEYNGNRTFPGSFHYLACAANSANNNYNEWYANAGYTRGVSKFTIESTGCKLGEMAIQALEPRFMLYIDKEEAKNEAGFPIVDEFGVKQYNDINTTVALNLIVKIKSSYYLWGNRTGKKLGTRYASDGDLVAQHFLNIRQLCTTIKKQVYTTCRRLTFDPNSNMLWLNFRSLLTPMLEEMKADQGIKDYKFVKNETDRKALLSARIRIVPIEAVEDFEIGLYLEDNLEDVVLTEA
jgi:hypothetical protein